MSTGSQSIKEEPTEIGIVNIPTSSSSGIGTKRPNPESANVETRKIHRIKANTPKEKKSKKNSSSSIKTRKFTRVEQNFSCERCLRDWGDKVQDKFDGNPNKAGVPDPKRTISNFSNIQDYKHHVTSFHDTYHIAINDPCEESSCIRWRCHITIKEVPHGDIICKICDLSFKHQKHHDQHIEIEHMDHHMTNKQFYDLYLKYDHSFFID